jgi:hypothetical protein
VFQRYWDTARRDPVEGFLLLRSWHEIEGRSQTGYYLGEQAVERWEHDQGPGLIARQRADVIDERVPRTLEELAKEGT